jgi:pyruvate carboxylase subunit B
MKKIIKVMNTSFRDGLQSVYGARVLTKDVLPAFEAALDAGFYHFEIGGGARYQSLYFYCNEDAFKQMSAFRNIAGPHIQLQAVARGVYAQSMEPESSDIINLHAKLFKKHGIDTMRNFDALNDHNNLIYSAECTVNNGLKHEVVVTMMDLPPKCEGAHDVNFYKMILNNILESGIPYDSICFKDASGSSNPRKVYETIKMARETVGPDVQLRFHTHETAGVSIVCYRAAIEAGIDAIDLAMAPVSGGTAQPDILTMMHNLKDTEYDLGFDMNKIVKAEEVFQECMADYFLPPEACAVSPLIPFSPMPGGALTTNTQMLRDNDLMDKFQDIIKAMNEAVSKGGFGTSVTPLSQFYFQQAFNNVMFGPWERIAPGYGKMVLGYLGRTPVAPDPEIVKIASEKLEMDPTTKSPLQMSDENPNLGIAFAKNMLKENELPETEENIFIAATCREKGIRFLKGEAKTNIRKISKAKTESPASNGFTVTVHGKKYGVILEGDKAIVNGKEYTYRID